MRLVFLGSPKPAVLPLRHLLESGEHEVLAVVSQPARPVGRKGILTDPPVAAFAKERGLPCLQPEKASDPEFLAKLRDLAPDIAITAAYGQILTDEFLAIPKRGTINIHPSLLPKYRGATPVPAALLEGERETGVTILFTVRKLDAGNLIVQRRTPIGENETAGELLTRLFAESGPLLLEALAKLEDESFTGEPQDETRVTHSKKIAKDDGRVAWHLSAREIVNRFRAFEPWPGSFTFLGDRRIVLCRVTLGEREGQGAPGSVRFDKERNALQVTTGQGTVMVWTLKPAGGKEVDAAAFWNGIKEKSDVRFDS